MRPPLLEIPISSGTLKTEDLITAFASELNAQMTDTHSLVKEARSWLEGPEQYVIKDQYEKGSVDEGGCTAQEAWEAASEDLLDEIRGVLENTAPPGFYFGTLEGDGACFGYWRVKDESR